MTKLLITAILTMLAPFSAFAQEAGSASLVIGSEGYEFPLHASQSDWGGSAAYGSINIYTKPTDEATWALFKQLTLGFTIMNGTVDAPEVSLYRMVDGEMQRLFGKKDTGAAITVDQVAIEGAFLTISGSFASDLGTSKDYGGTIDISDPLAISGTFDVVLGPVE